jgi:hypothetical protein
MWNASQALSVSSGVSAKIAATLGTAESWVTISCAAGGAPTPARKAVQSKPGARARTAYRLICLYILTGSRCSVCDQVASAILVSSAMIAFADSAGAGQPTSSRVRSTWPE